MDISNFNFKEATPAIMELCHPVTQETLKGDDDLPITITLHGSDSSVFRAAVREYGNRKLSKGAKKQTVEEIDQATTRILAKATVSWSDNFVVNGDALDCTMQNAEKIYADYSWIREQVDAFVNERANFLANA